MNLETQLGLKGWQQWKQEWHAIIFLARKPSPMAASVTNSGKTLQQLVANNTSLANTINKQKEELN